MRGDVQFQQLRTFYEVATTGSFTRAAEKLYLTQPAVTQQVRALETELGFPLLERQGRRIRLTPAGEALLAYPPRLMALQPNFFAVQRIPHATQLPKTV